MYQGLEHAPATCVPAAVDLYERAISLGAMAKVYGLGGLRIGWVALRDRGLFTQMAAFKDWTTICNSAPSEYLATVALRHHDELRARTRSLLRENLSHLEAFCARHAGRFAWSPPGGGTTMFLELRTGSASAFCADVVERAGIMLVPSTVFDAGDSYIRVGYGRRNLPEALAQLDLHIARGS